MKLVHQRTEIASLFGIMDDDGNIIQDIIVKTEGNDPLTIRIFSEEKFVEAFRSVLLYSEQAKEQLEKQNEVPNSNNHLSSDINN